MHICIYIYIYRYAYAFAYVYIYIYIAIVSLRVSRFHSFCNTDTAFAHVGPDVTTVKLAAKFAPLPAWTVPA